LSLAGSCVLQAQTNQAQTNPLITEARATYNNVKNNLVKAAEKMPEDAYTFKPTPEMQSWGQRIVHIANQIGTCSAMTGERKQSDAGAKEAKADLVAALKASFDACDAAWDSMNDKTAMEMIAGRGCAQRSKLGALIQHRPRHRTVRIPFGLHAAQGCGTALKRPRELGKRLAAVSGGLRRDAGGAIASNRSVPFCGRVANRGSRYASPPGIAHKIAVPDRSTRDSPCARDRNNVSDGHRPSGRAAPSGPRQKVSCANIDAWCSSQLTMSRPMAVPFRWYLR